MGLLRAVGRHRNPAGWPSAAVRSGELLVVFTIMLVLLCSGDVALAGCCPEGKKPPGCARCCIPWRWARITSPQGADLWRSYRKCPKHGWDFSGYETSLGEGTCVRWRATSASKEAVAIFYTDSQGEPDTFFMKRSRMSFIRNGNGDRIGNHCKGKYTKYRDCPPADCIGVDPSYTLGCK